jgi:hypothetical protein
MLILQLDLPSLPSMSILGRYYKAFIDDKFKNKIFLLEDDCADGKYQQYESDCIHACTNEHRDLNDIPERYVVFSMGETVNPTQVYCNFKLGFFNAYGNFLLDYDRDEFTYSFLCEHINDNNPCISTNLPLPSKSFVICFSFLILI